MNLLCLRGCEGVWSGDSVSVRVCVRGVCVRVGTVCADTATILGDHHQLSGYCPANALVS